jgi:hypothetical protein
VFQTVTCNLQDPTQCGTPVAANPTASNGTGTPSGNGSATPNGTGTQTPTVTVTGTLTVTATVTNTPTSTQGAPTVVPTTVVPPPTVPTSIPPTAVPTSIQPTTVPTVAPTSTTSSGGGSGGGTGGGSGSGGGAATSTPSNAPPVMSPVSAQSVSEGQTLIVNLSSTDPNANGLTYSVTGLTNTFMSFTDNGDGTAALSLAPGFSHAGTYSIYISVGDGAGGFANQTIQIIINNVVLDADADGIEDSLDNCPNDANASQTDWDADGEGDACDGEYHLRFGSAGNLTGSNGITYRAATATSDGTIYAVTNTGITGITDPDVCQTMIEARTGNTGKNITISFTSLPNGNYVVTFYLVEARTSRQGEFDIMVEGIKKFSKYMPDDVGYKIAHKVTASAQAIVGSTLNLELTRTNGIPSLCAIDIVKQ